MPEHRNSNAIEKQVGTRVIAEMFAIPRRTITDLVHAGKIPCADPPTPQEVAMKTKRPFHFYISEVTAWYRGGRRMSYPEPAKKPRHGKTSRSQLIQQAQDLGFRVVPSPTPDRR